MISTKKIVQKSGIKNSSEKWNKKIRERLTLDRRFRKVKKKRVAQKSEGNKEYTILQIFSHIGITSDLKSHSST